MHHQAQEVSIIIPSLSPDHSDIDMLHTLLFQNFWLKSSKFKLVNLWSPCFKCWPRGLAAACPVSSSDLSNYKQAAYILPIDPKYWAIVVIYIIIIIYMMMLIIMKA